MSLDTTKSVVEIWNRALNRIGETKAIQDTAERSAAAEICKRHYGDILVSVLEREHWGFATKQVQLNVAIAEWLGTTPYAVGADVRYNGIVYTATYTLGTTWAIGTTYALAARVNMTVGGVVYLYLSVQAANTGNDPSADDGTWWTLVGALSGHTPTDGGEWWAYAYGLGVGWEYAYAIPADFVSFIAFLTSTGSRFDQQPFDIINDGTGTGTVLVTNVSPDDFSVAEYTALPGLISAETGELVENPTLYSRKFVDVVVWLLAAELALGIKKDVGLADKMLAAGTQALSSAVAQRRNNIVPLPEPATPSVAIRQF